MIAADLKRHRGNSGSFDFIPFRRNIRDRISSETLKRFGCVPVLPPFFFLIPDKVLVKEAEDTTAENIVIDVRIFKHKGKIVVIIPCIQNRRIHSADTHSGIQIIELLLQPFLVRITDHNKELQLGKIADKPLGFTLIRLNHPLTDRIRFLIQSSIKVVQVLVNVDWRINKSKPQFIRNVV